ncbi:MAG: hypothetical protein U0793_17425 [Gemmataceae bacterium]
MRCWNCNRKVAKKAKRCPHCEADLTDAPQPEEFEAALDVLKNLPPDVLAEMRQLAEGSASAEDFVNSIFVGACPKCGSEETGDCEHDPEIGELLVGRCFACGQLWCTECEKLLEHKAPICACWDEEEPGG